MFDKTNECLEPMFKDIEKFIKEYIAICDGKFDKKIGTINLPIIRKENSIIERCVSPLGEEAITHYEVIKAENDYTILKCILETRKNSSNKSSFI